MDVASLVVILFVVQSEDCEFSTAVLLGRRMCLAVKIQLRLEMDSYQCGVNA